MSLELEPEGVPRLTARMERKMRSVAAKAIATAIRAGANKIAVSRLPDDERLLVMTDGVASFVEVK